MMGEPLKDKLVVTNHHLGINNTARGKCDNIEVFTKYNVKLAVEWMKNKFFNRFGHQTGGTIGEINEIINQSFPDLQKVKGKRK